MFTRRFFIILAVCIALALCGAVWPPALTLSVCLVALLFLITVVEAVFVNGFARGIAVNRTHDQNLSFNQPNQVNVDISVKGNKRLMPMLIVEAYDTLPASFVLGGDELMSGVGSHSYQVIPKKRGRYEFGVVRCFLRFRWPGFYQRVRFVNQLSQVRVYPTYHRLQHLEIDAKTSNSQGMTPLRRPGCNTEFEQIRSYVPGDDVRAINWRATARAVALMVNVYSNEQSVPVIPVVCAGPSMLVATDGVTLLDRATSAAVALAASAVRHYDEAGLITVDHRGVDTFIKPQRSSAVLARILTATYDFGLPPTPSELPFVDDPDVLPDGIDQSTLSKLHHRMDACEADADLGALADFVIKRLSRRTTLVLFANFENIEVAKMWAPVLSSITRRHNLIVVLFENEGVANVIREAQKNADDAANSLSEMRFRALCSDYLMQQQQLVAFLRQQRINVVLTTPAKLTTDILRKYLDMKTRNES